MVPKIAGSLLFKRDNCVFARSTLTFIMKREINRFLQSKGQYDRYASYDYCFNYFRKVKGDDLTQDMEKSCMVLMSYLASWGMYRGSAYLKEHSAKIFEELIIYISRSEDVVWNVDINTYPKHIPLLINTYEEIKDKLQVGTSVHKTLITKIMMGVYGNVPALDKYFCKGFKHITNGRCAFSSFGEKSLTTLYNFYQNRSSLVDSLSASYKTLSFQTGKPTRIHYTRAKIIDMYGFMIGKNL